MTTTKTTTRDSEPARPRADDLYPSRANGEAQVLPRRDPVVHGSGDRALPSCLQAEDVEFYRTNGFLLLPAFFDRARLDAARLALARLAESEEIKTAEESITEPDSGVVRSIFRVHTLSPAFDALARDSRLLGIARFLLDDEVYIHQSRVNLKPGFSGKEFYWHSDFETWHVEDGMPRMRAVSISISLTDNYEFNGPLMLMSGSHEFYLACAGETPEDNFKQSLRRQEIGVPDHDALTALMRKGGISTSTGPAGTVTVFDCNVMHGSNSNITPYPRSNAFFVYNSCSNRLLDPFGAPKPRPNFIGERELVAPLQDA